MIRKYVKGHELQENIAIRLLACSPDEERCCQSQEIFPSPPGQAEIWCGLGIVPTFATVTQFGVCCWPVGDTGHGRGSGHQSSLCILFSVVICHAFRAHPQGQFLK